MRTVLACLYLFVLVNSLEASAGPPYTKKELLTQLIKVNDENITSALKRQVLDKSSIYYGVVYDNDSIMSPIGTALFGFRKGEKVSWRVPAGKKTFTILEVTNGAQG